MRLTRLVPAAVFFAALLAVFVGLLWNLQVVSGAAY